MCAAEVENKVRNTIRLELTGRLLLSAAGIFWKVSLINSRGPIVGIRRTGTLAGSRATRTLGQSRGG